MLDYLTLPWLPAAPAGYRDAVKALDGHAAPGPEIARLATHGLDAMQLRQLGRAMARLRAAGTSLAPLAPIRVAVVSGTTFDFIADAAPAAAARHGVALELLVAPLDLVEQEVFAPGSATYAFRPDATLIAVDHRWLGLDRPAFDTADAAARVAAAHDRVGAIAAALVDNGGGTPILCTVPTPTAPLFGSFDRGFAGSVRAMVAAFNAGLADVAQRSSGVIFDVAALADLVGLARWFDAPLYNMYKLPFAASAVPLYVDWFGRLLGAMRGRTRKCLVLDLDNTCWGGVIGDDGIEGIRIGPGSPEGESFLAVQHAALLLKDRGIILAVSSKNDDANARAPFRDHPDMALRENDIAVFQANWQDKATNIEAIARTLEIGLDALVFLDDNGAERAQVRAALPTVAVPELPSDPALYAEILGAAGYFEAISFSSEDRSRAQSYAANAQRIEVQKQSRNLGDYLATLEMVIGHAPFDAIGRSRISQLINKSNQFNLTTRRYTEAEIAAVEAHPAAYTQQTRLADRFGSFGMIGVIIARPHPRAADGAADAWDIDTWLMSCRVLGRRVDESMLAQLVAAARQQGIATLHAAYKPTTKNGMVAGHYDALGFALVGELASGERQYRLEVADHVEPVLPMVTQGS